MRACSTFSSRSKQRRICCGNLSDMTRSLCRSGGSASCLSATDACQGHCR
jgi:hypothetical protein